jgi:hypothetical protein
MLVVNGLNCIEKWQTSNFNPTQPDFVQFERGLDCCHLCTKKHMTIQLARDMIWRPVSICKGSLSRGFLLRDALRSDLVEIHSLQVDADPAKDLVAR